MLDSVEAYFNVDVAVGHAVKNTPGGIDVKTNLVDFDRVTDAVSG